MFEESSRYAKLPVKVGIGSDGREVACVGRRIIPEDQQIIGETKVQEGDRDDLLANRLYGDPRAFWRVADANPDPDPEALADAPGRRLKVAAVKAE